jgi:NAD(P)-dependent dehydrogenase (short-subunit alcohol dehydrogenase family)/rhamnose utilization protein RhaD (predicted bifunctional aldolase and dehydrogenase)
MNMDKVLQELIEISNYYGRSKECVIGGGGNTSYKDEKILYVKASGAELASISKNGFVKLDRFKLEKITVKKYPPEESLRDKLLNEDLLKCCIDNELHLRPSVESPLHHLINYKFVVHTHPTWINALLCSKNAAEFINKNFPSDVLFIPYKNPGYVLFKTLLDDIKNYRQKYLYDPKIILVQNHGAFISANTTEEIIKLYDVLLGIVKNEIKVSFNLEELPVNHKLTRVIPALRMLLSQDSVKLVKLKYNPLIEHFIQNEKTVKSISFPFTPDNIVYCRTHPLYIESMGSPEEIITEFIHKLREFRSEYDYSPKIVLIKEIGMLAIDDNIRMVETISDVFEDLMKISYLSDSFGGPHFMTDSQISYIESWESEKYREGLSRGSEKGRLVNKVAIITGAAQGFGSGIAQGMILEGANVVIADLNEAKAAEFAKELNKIAKRNKATFLKTDVSNSDSVESLIRFTVKEFGGFDILISNAGILHAGSLEEMKPETFELVTKVNYTGYFLCVKFASVVLKIQGKYRKEYFSDIIQINSKSGLRGSKMNFAYAGSKFGGIGLTQSFALELMEFRIKVNSICPGNFYDGPLWSDPEKGLFVQYLGTGKVPGAKTIKDVRKFYESQVPAKRGCTVQDVMRAVYYVIEQEYETGQAIPVTGGQVMLG